MKEMAMKLLAEAKEALSSRGCCADKEFKALEGLYEDILSYEVLFTQVRWLGFWPLQKVIINLICV